MARPPAAVDKSPRAIREMFAEVAPRYDLLNHLLSASLDHSWRRRAAAAVAGPGGGLLLDLCCGTGDQAIALHRSGARVVAADFCLPMLALAKAKYRRLPGAGPGGVAGDALHLPFPPRRFTGATVAFGLRNVSNLPAALDELARVLSPGGRLAVLEFALPRIRALRAAYLFYFRHLLPRIGQLLSPRGAAYGYLRDSVLSFPQRRGFLEAMAAAGFQELAWRDLSGGIVCLYTGRRAP